ncbi:hypothetical protein [Sporosarcina limicola]|uniref:Transcriptional/translational regulatory protein YebC/TACO1 n=1 Tax=Sporosarcina limicola TaxID=34101 RepID=A0A927MNS5_9BACL|nr:hypothetical protein [Sporosarcina limicola]MBE1554591.1 transcriptional/translational regulatory protein YebC/TACO1 [Sporosarcina limicola]
MAALEARGIEFVSAEIEMIPSMYMELTETTSRCSRRCSKCLKTINDAQDSYHNASK